jgi:hypothetical protein
MSHTRQVLSFPPPATRLFVTSHETIELLLPPPLSVAIIEPSDTFQILTVPSTLPHVASISVSTVLHLCKINFQDKKGSNVAEVRVRHQNFRMDHMLQCLSLEKRSKHVLYVPDTSNFLAMGLDDLIRLRRNHDRYRYIVSIIIIITTSTVLSRIIWN